eukprot:maker-scaffold_11-snap-gene-0.2-mRNA-1 protein AED:0.37 eAED:0.37 QI:0/1/0.5/1/0/0/2/479/1252
MNIRFPVSLVEVEKNTRRVQTEKNLSIKRIHDVEKGCCPYGHKLTKLGIELFVKDSDIVRELPLYCHGCDTFVTVQNVQEGFSHCSICFTQQEIQPFILCSNCSDNKGRVSTLPSIPKCFVGHVLTKKSSDSLKTFMLDLPYSTPSLETLNCNFCFCSLPDSGYVCSQCGLLENFNHLYCESCALSEQCIAFYGEESIDRGSMFHGFYCKATNFFQFCSVKGSKLKLLPLELNESGRVHRLYLAAITESQHIITRVFLGSKTNIQISTGFNSVENKTHTVEEFLDLLVNKEFQSNQFNKEFAANYCIENYLSIQICLQEYYVKGDQLFLSSFPVFLQCFCPGWFNYFATQFKILSSDVFALFIADIETSLIKFLSLDLFQQNIELDLFLYFLTSCFSQNENLCLWDYISSSTQHETIDAFVIPLNNCILNSFHNAQLTSSWAELFSIIWVKSTSRNLVESFTLFKTKFSFFTNNTHEYVKLYFFLSINLYITQDKVFTIYANSLKLELEKYVSVTLQRNGRFFSSQRLENTKTQTEEIGLYDKYSEKFIVILLCQYKRIFGLLENSVAFIELLLPCMLLDLFYKGYLPSNLEKEQILNSIIVNQNQLVLKDSFILTVLKSNTADEFKFQILSILLEGDYIKVSFVQAYEVLVILAEKLENISTDSLIKLLKSYEIILQKIEVSTPDFWTSLQKVIDTRYAKTGGAQRLSNTLLLFVPFCLSVVSSESLASIKLNINIDIRELKDALLNFYNSPPFESLRDDEKEFLTVNVNTIDFKGSAFLETLGKCLCFLGKELKNIQHKPKVGSRKLLKYFLKSTLNLASMNENPKVNKIFHIFWFELMAEQSQPESISSGISIGGKLIIPGISSSLRIMSLGSYNDFSEIAKALESEILAATKPEHIQRILSNIIVFLNENLLNYEHSFNSEKDIETAVYKLQRGFHLMCGVNNVLKTNTLSKTWCENIRLKLGNLASSIIKKNYNKSRIFGFAKINTLYFVSMASRFRRSLVSESYEMLVELMNLGNFPKLSERHLFIDGIRFSFSSHSKFKTLLRSGPPLDALESKKLLIYSFMHMENSKGDVEKVANIFQSTKTLLQTHNNIILNTSLVHALVRWLEVVAHTFRTTGKNDKVKRIELRIQERLFNSAALGICAYILKLEHDSYAEENTLLSKVTTIVYEVTKRVQHALINFGEIADFQGLQRNLIQNEYEALQRSHKKGLHLLFRTVQEARIGKYLGKSFCQKVETFLRSTSRFER